MTRRLLMTIVLVAALVQWAQGADRQILSRIEPEYPEVAKKMQLHSTIKLKLSVDPDGTVARVEYITGHPMLSFAAISAAKKWKYQVAGKESTEVVELRF